MLLVVDGGGGRDGRWTDGGRIEFGGRHHDSTQLTADLAGSLFTSHVDCIYSSVDTIFGEFNIEKDTIRTQQPDKPDTVP